MACTSHSLSELLERHQIYRLDVAEHDDPNDITTFLKLEGLLVKLLLETNRSAKEQLLKDIDFLAGVNFNRISTAEQAKLFRQVDIALDDYLKRVIPEQSKHLPEQLQNIGQQTHRILSEQIAELRKPAPIDMGMPVTPTPKPVGLVTQAKQSLSFAQSSWSQRDTTAMQYLAKQQAMYAGKNLDDVLRNRARKIITRDYSLYGDNVEKITQIVKDNLVSMVDVSDQYWRVFATNALNHARTYANLSAMSGNGVKQFRFVAVMDNRTTVICSSLNNKVWPVQPALDRFDRMLSATELSELEALHPFVTGKEVDGQTVFTTRTGQTFSDTDEAYLLSIGAYFPPLHFLCRSTIKPEI